MKRSARKANRKRDVEDVRGKVQGANSAGASRVHVAALIAEARHSTGCGANSRVTAPSSNQLPIEKYAAVPRTRRQNMNHIKRLKQVLSQRRSSKLQVRTLGYIVG